MKKAITITISCLLIAIVSVCAIKYVMPFVNINRVIVAVNKQYTEDEGLSWISGEDIRKLQIIEEKYRKEDGYYVSLDTRLSFKKFTLDKIVVIYEITATVKEFDTWEEVANYKESKELELIFSILKLKEVKVK